MSLAGVMIMGFLAMTLGSLVEIFYIGMVGKEELAAIAFSFPISMGLNAMTRGIGVGASSLIARHMGEGARDKAAVITTHGYILIISFTLILLLLGQLYADRLFMIMGAEGEVLALVTGYAHIWLYGFPMMGLAMVSNGLTRSMGSVRFAGYIMTVGPVVQVCLGPFLIFGWLGLPALGLEGAAWAFLVSSTCQVMVAAYWFFIKERLFRGHLQGFGQSTFNILHVGVPAAATNLIQPLSAGVVTWLLAGYGLTVVAGFGVASRIESVVAMVVVGISTSIVPIVGQNWGARQIDRVREAIRTCYFAGMIWSGIAATIMWIGAPYFVSVINDDPALVDVAVTFLYIVPISIGFMGLINVSTHSFNALRKPAPALILSTARLLVVYIPIAFIASHYFGYIGVFVATALANVIVGISAVIWNRLVMAKEWDRMIKDDAALVAA